MLSALNDNAFDISADLPEIRNAFRGLVAGVYLAHEAVKDFDFAGVGVLVQFVDQAARKK